MFTLALICGSISFPIWMILFLPFMLLLDFLF